MDATETIEHLQEREICWNCVGEDFLRNQIFQQGKEGTCSYCGEVGECYSIEQMSGIFEVAFDQHYYKTSDQPTSYQYMMLADKESTYDWERDGEEVTYAIMNAANIPEEAASDIQTILEEKFYDFDTAEMGEETEFSSDSYYEESGTSDERWQEKWRKFEYSLKNETRFFSRSAYSLLTSLFEGIEAMQTWTGQSLIIDAGPGTEHAEIFRARSFQSDETLKDALARPERHLGSPPSSNARAGRMNAHGISVFYGSNKASVALAEVRPPVGSQVAVTRFDIIRPIRLLDLTALGDIKKTGSIFDPSFINHLERTTFLQNLSRIITIPVMPDHETFEYLTTQAIADFLATENDPPLDGIAFPSVQTADTDLNFVLFHKAARVEKNAIPKGTEIRVTLAQMYEEGWEREYSVIEEVPDEEEGGGDSMVPGFGGSGKPLDLDKRSPTLRIDLDSLRVHTVDAVQFKTAEYSVSRHRWKKTDFQF